MSKLKWVLLAAFLVFLAFVLDTQLIVLRDEGMFTLHYEVPKDMEGKMFASAYWISDSPMCRQLSFGTGKFEPQGYGASARNVEEKPGTWVSHIPTRIWHPFCQWELDLVTIGVHSNAEKTNYHQLAYAILYEPRDTKSGDETRQGYSRNRNNESRLVCDILEYDFERNDEYGKYIEKNNSYECKSPNSRGNKSASDTPYVSFSKLKSGILKINFSGNKTVFITRTFFESKKNRYVSHNKDIKYSNKCIYSINALLSKDIYWNIEKRKDLYEVSIGIPGFNPKSKYLAVLNPEQLAFLASDNVWEVPDFIQQ